MYCLVWFFIEDVMELAAYRLFDPEAGRGSSRASGSTTRAWSQIESRVRTGFHAQRILSGLLNGIVGGRA